MPATATRLSGFSESVIRGDVFINSLAVVDGKLQVQNERGKIYWLDLKSGDEEGDWG